MESLKAVLSNHPFVRDLDPDHVEMLISCGKSARFEQGEYLAREGGPADAFYLIESGEVALEIHAPHQGATLVDKLEAGDALGWSWLVGPYRWHFDARALRPVNVIVLDGRCLRTECEMNHELGYQLLKRLSQVLEHRLEATRLRVVELHAVPV
ncbi:MAG TPA: cyclic nucleotide-binding domain-containing protein [Bryobacteraceae bacterium]|nr:cyclic nucleotide-binding domain-containing protein [Bryobacteraceae bacterium]